MNFNGKFAAKVLTITSGGSRRIWKNERKMINFAKEEGVSLYCDECNWKGRKRTVTVACLGKESLRAGTQSSSQMITQWLLVECHRDSSVTRTDTRTKLNHQLCRHVTHFFSFYFPYIFHQNLNASYFHLSSPFCFQPPCVQPSINSTLYYK